MVGGKYEKSPGGSLPPGASSQGLLIDQVFRETFRSPKKSMIAKIQPRSLEKIRQSVVEAKRFVLDASMSAFLSDLSIAPFLRSSSRHTEIMTSLRHSAIPPFPKIWIEIEAVPMHKRMLELKREASIETSDAFGNEFNPEDSIAKVGLLIEQNGEEVFVTTFGEHPDAKYPFTLPYAYIYRTDDDPILSGADPRMDHKAAVFGHGVFRMFEDPTMAIIYSMPLDKFSKEDQVLCKHPSGDFPVHAMVPEFGGTLRRVFAFLATLNSIPKVESEGRSPRGFLGGGQLRKYLDHTVLTLRLPGKKTSLQVARSAIAQARRGWHEVRPHWRITVKDEGRECSSRSDHIWSALDDSGRARCSQCDAVRKWIVLPNGRGDPTVSVRTHKYEVTHGKR